VTDIAGPGLAQVGGALEFDLSEFSALSATPHATADSYLISDGGTEKTITVTHAANGAFALVSGDATIAAGGALTIAATSVNGSMINTDAISAQTAMTGDVADADELMISDAGTLKRVDFSVFRDAVFNDVSGDAAIADGGALTIAAGSVENSMLADDAVDSDELAAGAVDLAHMSANSVDSAQYVDGSIDTAHFAAGAVDAAAMGANSVDSSELVDGSVDLSHMSVNSIDSDQYVDGSIDTAHIANDQITNALMADDAIDSDQLAAGSVDLAHMSVNSIDSDQYVDASIDTAHIANDQITNALMADDAIDSAQLAAGSVDDAHLSDGVATGLAGGGLSAASGVLSVTGNNCSLKADSNALVEGYNYFADASSNATVTLPTVRTVGDVVVAKAGNLTSNAIITINKGDASDRIDGLESIILESPFASVTMVYVVANAWRIV
jgi:hypothetical protein